MQPIVERMRKTFASGRTRDLTWREAQLDALGQLLTEHEQEIVEALAVDVGKPRLEAWATDIAATQREITELRRNLRRWAADEQVRVPVIFRPGRAVVRREPLGVVLVIGPWNYPVQLVLAPLAAALAAGNAVVCKFSELAPATSALFARLLPMFLDPGAVAVVEGGVPEATELLEQRWDHIFYTGNGRVGRIVAAAAAKHLTPTTLELGGRSPVIVHADANLKRAASKIVFARFLNAGQTCIGANHVFVHRGVEEELVRLIGKELRHRYGKDPRTSRDYARIVSTHHVERIKGLLDGGGYGEIACGGEVDVADRYVAPTVLRHTSPDAPVLGEEIFGPLLPLITYDSLDEPIEAINAGDKPLALYVFTDSKVTADEVLSRTSSGGAVVNDAIVHLLVPGLPFGGVGESGYGAYHGKAGFETFSHRRSVLRRPGFMPDSPLLNPPYSGWKTKVLRRVL